MVVNVINLKPDHVAIVSRILAEHVSDYEVRALGSRVTRTARAHSDLDLAVVGEGPLDPRVIGRLNEAFEESRLPMQVHVLDWHSIPERLEKDINQHYIVVQKVRQEHWYSTRLRDVAHVNKATYSPNEEWPFINYLDTGSITENRISKLKRLVPGQDKIPSRARRKVKPGDIVYSTVRPNQRHYGFFREVPDNLLASTGFAVLNGRRDLVDSAYLYWYLTQDHIVSYLQLLAEDNTSAYPAIRPADLESLTISLPPLDEQQTIARMLCTLDDKIELNRRMSETLEEMARAMFTSWFVDFDPVRAKMEGRWQPGESLPGLPAHLYDLFPDRFVDSRLGPIPEGWQVGQLGDYADITKGTSYRRTELAESDTALVTLRSFKRGGGYKTGGLKPYTGTYRPEQVLTPGDVIVACTDVTQAGEVIGRSARVGPNIRYETLVASLDMVAIRPTPSRMISTFLDQLCRSYRFVALMGGYSTGTTVLHLAKSAISDFEFAVPSYNVLESYDNLSRHLASRDNLNHFNSPIVKALRNAQVIGLFRH